MNTLRPGKGKSYLRGRMYTELSKDNSGWFKVWTEEIIHKLPITFNINLTDFFSAIKYYKAIDQASLRKQITLIQELGNLHTLLWGTEDDYAFVMELVGWTNNTTTVYWLSPKMQFPENESDIESHLAASIKFMRSVLEMVDIFELMVQHFPQTDPPPWINDQEMANEIRQRTFNNDDYLEDIFKDDPPLWLEIVKLVKSQKTDKEIAIRLGKQPGTISTRLTKIRKAHPEVTFLRRIAKPKVKSKKDVKKVKEMQ